MPWAPKCLLYQGPSSAQLSRREHSTCVKPWLCLDQLLGIHLEDSGLRDWRQAGWAHLPSTDRLMEGPAAP